MVAGKQSNPAGACLKTLSSFEKSLKVMACSTPRATVAAMSSSHRQGRFIRCRACWVKRKKVSTGKLGLADDESNKNLDTVEQARTKVTALMTPMLKEYISEAEAAADNQMKKHRAEKVAMQERSPRPAGTARRGTEDAPYS